MNKLWYCLLIVSMSFALAAPRTQTVSMTVKQSGKHLVLEVQTEDLSWHEMSFYIYQPGGSRDFDRRIVPPYQPGLYRLEYTFQDDGFWEVSLRSGIGLDRYYGEINLEIDEGTKTFTRRSVFHSDLETTTPRYIQSIGFAIFGVLLLLTLVLIGSILRWLKRHIQSTV